MAQSMGKTAQTMAKMNKQMDPQKMAKTLAQFERENMKMEMSGEMMDDAMGEFFFAKYWCKFITHHFLKRSLKRYLWGIN